MLLPDGVKKLKQQQQQQEVEETTTETPAIPAPLHSSINAKTKVRDVEYEEDYESDRFNEIPSMAQTFDNTTLTNITHLVREFSIDMWNGSPGMRHWGYDDSNHSR
jgi:hypothetical protein